MKVFIKILVFCSILIGIVPCTYAEIAVGNNDTIVARGSDNYPPFEFINEKGEPDGFNVDLFKAVMQNAGVPYVIKLGNWEEAVDDLYNHRIDALLGMINSDERAHYVRFCIAHCEMNRSIICRKNDPYRDLMSLAGKEIIVQDGGWSHDYLKIHHLTTKIILVKNTEEALSLLSSGKYDAFIGSDLVSTYLMKQNGYNNLKIYPTTIRSQRYSMAVDPNNDRLLPTINVGLQNLKVSGEYDKIYNKWFDVYDGLSPLSKTIYYSLAIAILLALSAFAIIHLLRNKIRKATKNLDALNSNLQLSLKAGELSAWKYDISKQMIFSLYGETVAKDGVLLGEFVHLFYGGDAKIFTQALEYLIDGKEETASIVVRIKNNDNNYSCYQSEMIVERDKKSVIKYIIGTQKDITEKQRLEEEKKEVALALKMAVRAASLHVSHYDVISDYYYSLKENGFVKTSDTLSSMMDKIHPDDKAIYKDIIDSLIRAKSESEAVILRIFDSIKSEYSYCETCLIAITNLHGEVTKIAINQRDITTKYLKKMEIESARMSLNMAMSAAELTAWEYNLTTKKSRILYGNPDYELGKEMTAEFVHPDYLDLYLESIQKILNEESSTEELTIRAKKNGNIYGYFESIISSVKNTDGKIVNLIGSLKDITKRVESEQTLIETNNKLKRLNWKNELILNNTNSGLAFIRSNYIVEWQNVSACSASISYEAYKKGELCYKSAYNRDTPCDNCVMQRVMKSREVEQIIFPLKNGNTIEVFATPVIDENDEMLGVVVRIDDITERNRIYQELASAKEKAEESDKLKSAFLANMSHEIRTPLNAIVGFSELIVSCDDPTEKEEYSRIITTNNSLLLKLINDILELSKIEAGFVKLNNNQFNLSKVFDDIAMMMRPNVKSGVEFICENPYPSCIVEFDSNRFTQIITNFITNAIKFTTKGHIRMGYECCGGGVRFFVEDTGIGISKENLSKVFTRFEKVDDFAQGTGLGMTICKAIIEAVNGEIGVDSKENEGSTFWAFVPCKPRYSGNDGSNSLEDSEFTESKEIDEKRYSVLIVEDTLSNFLLMSSILRAEFDLDRAENGAIAVDKVREGQYDIVLMDMKMPMKNGLEATADIRKFNPTIPIVAVTAHAFNSDREAAMDAGCNDYLTKPVKQDLLVRILKKHCRRS